MKLGEVIRRWRVVSERNVRDVAAEIGISAATLSRIERGQKMDGGSLALVLNWLMAPCCRCNVDKK